MYFEELVSLFDELTVNPSRLKKTEIIARFLARAPEDDIEIVCTFLTGRIFPAWDTRDIGVAGKTLIKVISNIGGKSTEEVIASYRDTGHLGLTAERLLDKKVTSSLAAFEEDLTVAELYHEFEELAAATGKGSAQKKQRMLASLLSRATPRESYYIVSLALRNLLIGSKEGVTEDAISQSFGVPADAVRRAWMLTNDIGLVARIAKIEGISGLRALNIEPMRPVRPMLAQNVVGAREALDVMGGKAAFETKYDGARIQVHKSGPALKLFSRKMEDLTDALPDIRRALSDSIHADSVILDCETIAVDKRTGKVIPFQNVLNRIRRKYRISELSDQIPMQLRPFDILYLNGESLVDRPFVERRALLEKTVKAIDERCTPSEFKILNDPEAVNAFFKESIDAGHEGLMAKDLNADYSPGIRGRKMVKLKETLESLDLVVIAAEYGHGRKAGWITSYELAARDEDNERWAPVGRVSSGASDEQLKNLTQQLKPLIIGEHGRMVDLEPQIVLEVKFNEIQKSPNYASGYALRFPRIVRVRDDKGPEDAETLERLESLYRLQFKLRAGT
ncbi:MAG TPA: ATP-dependent DNA ligase [Candidatus Bathyarchaeia archaeon]|nr:ATP-dependent DNA ligase [Candidatus Bathyarchaeia archaeon]